MTLPCDQKIVTLAPGPGSGPAPASAPGNAWAAAVARACKIIDQGGTVIFPAKCLYGIAADPFNPKAVERIFEIKMRPETNPILLLINAMDDLGSLVKEIPPEAVVLMNRFWPGDVTIVFEASSRLPGTLTAQTGKIGIRMPHHPVARALVRRLGRPITGTSANFSGTMGTSRIQDLPQALVDRIDLVLDVGELKGGSGSTVVDVTGQQVRVLREGEIPGSNIHGALHNHKTRNLEINKRQGKD